MYLSCIAKTYIADLPIMHCLSKVRCMILYLDCITIMRFEKKIAIVCVHLLVL